MKPEASTVPQESYGSSGTISINMVNAQNGMAKCDSSTPVVTDVEWHAKGLSHVWITWTYRGVTYRTVFKYVRMVTNGASLNPLNPDQLNAGLADQIAAQAAPLLMKKGMYPTK